MRLPSDPPHAVKNRTEAAGTSRVFSGIERKWWVLIAVGAGTFMSALDVSVVNTILPVINRTYQTDVATSGWVVVIYLLLVSSLLLTFGRLGDIKGLKPVYVSGFFVFILSSALCGLSPSIGALIAFRGLQALGAAMITSNAPAILTRNFPEAQRGRALGLQATMTYLGLVAGPSLGGWLADQFTWRTVFYINIPVGLVALLLSIAMIPRDAPSGRGERFDIPGGLTFMAGLSALLLGLNRGHEWGWSSPAILGLLASALVLLAVFLRIELRSPHPMLDLSLFRSRVFTAAVASAVLNYICVYSNTFLMPFYLIQGRGLDSSQAGLVLAAHPLVMAAVAPFSGALSDRIGARLPGTLGMALLAAGLYLLSRLGASTPYLWVVASLGLAGLGVGLFVSPNTSALLGSAPQNRKGIASGVLATARNFGMVLGSGIAMAIFTTVMAQGGDGQNGMLFEAVRAGFTAAIGIALLGTLTSAVRGDQQPA